MSTHPLPPTNAKARRRVSTVQQVGPYTVHMSFVDQRTRAAVSRRGQVIARCFDVPSGVAWATERLRAIAMGQTRQNND